MPNFYRHVLYRSIFYRNTMRVLAVLTLSAVGAARLVADSQGSTSSVQEPVTPVYPSDAVAHNDGAAPPQTGGPNNNADMMRHDASENAPDKAPDNGRELHKADGRRQPGVPPETYAVAPGAKFLVRLDDDLSTKGMEENHHFRMTTLEPLEAGDGIYLPAGAEIEGHVTRAESAGMAGRAKLWLTFDYIHTRFGKLPIVAEVSSIPGDHSVKSDVTKEGLIEGRSSTQKDAEEAAATAAALGAVKGIKDKDKKEAAESAAMAAFAAYLAESGRGQEINLQHGIKFELELERALYLLKE